ncbi:LysM peptidoglycan-binding domain-containing protein [Metabacillus halosaccharovorans]|uniref:LysM peptidoglycan-binding domain-containing protein n=1 Tax=Metabacillus halosaccharovorans TaxID=930124 RepID=UPI000995B38A|nr:LysM peptidoglycan-binding domain-containing protein [Metabacillus halosaccharovorans]
MNDLEKRSDQAEGLRTRMIDEYKQENGKYPPRSEIHKGKDKKTKPKLKYPIISILALFFILLPILILSLNLYYGSQEDESSTDKLNIGEDRVYIPKIKESDNQSIETEQSQNENEVIESETKGNSNTSDENEVADESAPTIETKEKQNESETVNSTSTTTNEVTQSEGNEKDSEKQYSEIKTHKVAAGETLFSIAIKYYNNRSGEEIIRQYNQFSGNEIYEGQLLKIPIK